MPKLEPLTAAALALNLAYLGLNKFRYRTLIARHAAAELDRIKPAAGTPQAQRLYESKWCKQVRRLALLPADESAPKETLADRRATKIKDGYLGWLFSTFYERGWDRGIACIGTGVAVICLVAGVAHAIDTWPWTTCIFGKRVIAVWFYLLCFSIIWPMIAVFYGREIVEWARAFATECIGELEKLMQSDVEKAELRTPPLSPTAPAADGAAINRMLRFM